VNFVEIPAHSLSGAGLWEDKRTILFIGLIRSGLLEDTKFIHPAGHCFAPFPKRSDMLFCGAKKHAKNPSAADAF